MLSQMAQSLSQPAQLSTSQQGLFSALSNSLAPMPQVDPNNPYSLNAAAQEAARRGDQPMARTYAVMAQQLETTQYNKRQEQEVMRLRKEKIALQHGANSNLMAEIAGKEKQKEKEAADVQRMINAATPRIGEVNAAILEAVAPSQAASVLQTMLNNRGEKYTTRNVLDDEGNTVQELMDGKGNTVKRIPGIVKAAPKDKDEGGRSLVSKLVDLDSAFAALDNVEELIEEGGAGREYDAMNRVPWTDNRALKNALLPVQSKLAFDRLTKMREESKTGGALGQVSERELALLQSNISALDPGSKAFPQQVVAIRRSYENFRAALTGQPANIDWSYYEKIGMSAEIDGTRYWKNVETGQWETL